MNYPEMAFTPAVKDLQERYGSRASYGRMEQFRYTDGLTDAEIDFIAQQDNFFMGTVSENGFPYIQYRGGPKGFLKVLDSETLGFLDFSGNKQYISTGNLATNIKMSLFILDQAARTRLKLFVEGKVLDLESHPDLHDKLDLKNYKFRPERIITMKVKAYDWNCQQHIIPRYTLEEIQDQFELQHQYIETLRAENARLKAQLKEKN